MKGYIKWYRKSTEWEWYKDSIVKSVMLHLVIIAQHRDFQYQGHTIKTGQVLTTTQQLAEQTGLTTQQIRTAIKKLESTNDISRIATNKSTLITVENYTKYQADEELANKRITNEQQTNNKPTNKNVKNVKNDYITTTTTNNILSNDNNNIYKYIYNKSGGSGDHEDYKSIMSLLTQEDMEKLESMYYDSFNLICEISDIAEANHTRVMNPIGYVIGYAKKTGWERKPVI